jgi:rubrerythrin
MDISTSTGGERNRRMADKEPDKKMVEDYQVGWKCVSCHHFMTDNPRSCPNCNFTVYKPVWLSEVQK